MWQSSRGYRLFLVIACALPLLLPWTDSAILASAEAKAETSVAFVDPGLETAIREALGQPDGPLTESALAGLTSLNLEGKRILSLEGLQACQGLTELNLAYNFFIPRPWCITGWSPTLDNVSLMPLASLANLERLDLQGNDIATLDAIAGLTKLKHLDLSGNRITKLDFLAGLTQLETLHLSLDWGEEPISLALLGSLHRLRDLSLGGYSVSGTEALGQLTSLETLGLYSLDMGEEHAFSLPPLDALDHLKEFSIRSTSLRSLESLRGCEALEEVIASENLIEDFDALTTCPRLRILTIEQNRLLRVPSGRALKSLEELRIYGQGDPDDAAKNLSLPNLDLAPLNGAPALKILAMSHIPQRGMSIGDLPDLPRLEDFSGLVNSPRELAAMGQWTALKTARVGFAAGADLTPIGGLPRLESITLWGEAVDLMPLSQLPRLTTLYSQIIATDGVSGIAQCRQLQTLSMAVPAGATSFELAPILNLPALESLTLTTEGDWNDPPRIIDLGNARSAGPLRNFELAESDNIAWSGLPAIPALESFSMNWCTRIDPVWASNYPALKHLSVSPRSGMLDLEPLRAFTQLETLELMFGLYGDLGPVLALPHLRALTLSDSGDFEGSGISVVVADTQLPILRERGVKIIPEQLEPLTDEQFQARLDSNALLADIRAPQPVAIPQEIGGWRSIAISAAITTDVAAIVDVPDPVLAKEIRRVLRLAEDAPITTADLTRITALSFLSGEGAITDLTGLQHCTALTTLNLSGHPGITDLSPIANLPELFSLSIQGTGIADFTSLAGCPKLVALAIGDHRAGNYMEGESIGRVPDLQQLAALPRLTALDLNDSVLTSPEGVQVLTQLTSLSLSLLPIRDLMPLSGLVQLQSLNLENMEVADLSALAGLTRLRQLKASQERKSGDDRATESVDVSALSEMTQLEELRLSYFPHLDLAPLAGLPQLKTLSLCGNDLRTCDGLRDLPKLESLRITDNLQSFEGLGNCPQLLRIEAERSSNPDCSALAHLPKLETLKLKGSGMTSFESLCGLTAIRDLDLGFNASSDLTPLAGLTTLETLELSCLNCWEIQEAEKAGTAPPPALSDLSPLAGLMQLTTLHLYGNAVSDLTPLQGLLHLTSLSLHGNQVTDLTPLVDGAVFAEGGDLSLEGNPIDVGAQAANLRALEARQVYVMWRGSSE